MKTARRVIKVDSIKDFEFYVGMYRLKSASFRGKELRRVLSKLDEKDRGDKLRALDFLIGAANLK